MSNPCIRKVDKTRTMTCRERHLVNNLRDKRVREMSLSYIRKVDKTGIIICRETHLVNTVSG